MVEMYCVKCRKFMETRDVKQKTTKNNRQMLQGICVVCGTKKSKFYSDSGKVNGKGFLNDTINSLPIDWGFCRKRIERDFQTEKTRKALDR